MEPSDMISLIKHQLISDRLAAELKWFWFRAALFSYKRNFLVRPFPPTFRERTSDSETVSGNSVPDDDENKDFERLAAVASSMPHLCTLAKNEYDGSIESLSPDQIRLLAWVFDTGKQFRLSSTEKQMYQQIKELTGQQYVTKVPEPDYVFRIDYDDEAEMRFQKRRGDRRNTFAYHGSRLPNFYSIIRNGLRSNLNQVSAFGEGTYLSPELSVSLNWSPMSSVVGACSQRDTSGAGVFDGLRMSCVAVCELIDDPTGGGVSRCDCAFDANSSNVAGNSTTDSGRRGNNTMPDRYVLVKNDELLRIRYILAYVDRSNVGKPPAGRGMSICDRVSAFCSHHRFWLIMLAYILLLAVVGLLNSNNFQWYVRRFWSSAAYDYGFFDNDNRAENYHRTYEDA